MEAIVNAVLKFANVYSLQLDAIMTLGNTLLHLGATPLRAEVVRRIVEDLDVIKVSVQAMNHFSNHATIHCMCCYLFRQIIREDMYRTNMIDEGAVEAVGKALRKHRDNANNTEKANKFMKVMFADV